MINTWSKFYYGTDVTEDTQSLPFDEGGSTITATLRVGSYSLTQFAEEIERALNLAGDNVYTVSLNRTTRILTISADGDFALNFSSGSATLLAALMGFPVSDTSDDDTHSGSSALGSVYSPQFKLQSYVSTDDHQSAALSTVNKSASGKVQVQRFGIESFMSCNIRFATDIPQHSGGPIRNNTTGVSDLRTFMQYIVTKAPIEFIPDENAPDTFETLLLESTPDYSDGTGYKLKELYDQGLVGYYETGVLKFREVLE